MMKREYHGFESWSDVARQFQTDIGPEPTKVWAAYGESTYYGHAVVIFFRGRKWWLAGGSHCSCYGLEGQWDPEKFSPNLHFDALKAGKRIIQGVPDGGLSGMSDMDVDKWLRQNARQ